MSLQHGIQLGINDALEDDIDVSRGDMLVRLNNQPDVVSVLDARICWLGEKPLNPSSRFILRHLTQEVQAKVTEILYCIDINTLHRDEDNKNIVTNDIARIKIKTASPILTDSYRKNRTTGAFILVDPSTHLTVAAGVVG